jgi:hypothetical protein
MAQAEGTPGSAGLSRIPFTLAAENQLKSLSFWLTIVGWISVIGGVADLLSLVLPSRNIGHLFNAVIQLALGGWSLEAARAFKNVATTDVADQAYLVQGFRKLRSIFLIQGVMILVGMAFLAAVLLFLVLVGINTR